MMNQTLRRSAGILSALGVALLINSATAADGWIEDFEGAKATAEKEKKDLLLDFTGSDWCGWCIELRNQVFSKDEFNKEASKYFVLVELDYPQEKKQDPKIKEQNAKLAKQFRIEGYPTVVLADAKGRAYATTGFTEGGPKAYLEMLADLRKVREDRDAAFAKAEKAEGLDKAKLLKEGLDHLDPELVQTHYGAEIDEIIKIDEQDTLGMKKERAFFVAAANLDEKLSAIHQAMAEAGQGGKETELKAKAKEFAATIDTFIEQEKLEGEQKQATLLKKLSVLGPDDLAAAEKLLADIIKIDEKSETADQARQIQAQIASIQQQIEKSKGGGADEPEAEDKEDKPAPNKDKQAEDKKSE